MPSYQDSRRIDEWRGLFIKVMTDGLTIERFMDAYSLIKPPPKTRLLVCANAFPRGNIYIFKENEDDWFIHQDDFDAIKIECAKNIPTFNIQYFGYDRLAGMDAILNCDDAFEQRLKVLCV